jgi:hypothetical protein
MSCSSDSGQTEALLAFGRVITFLGLLFDGTEQTGNTHGIIV